MRRQCDECYVLETFELGEADLIVTLLAHDHGKVRAVARHGRQSRRRFGGALEPLTRLRAEWVEREGQDLHRLESVECLRSFAAMQSEPELQAVCAVLAEIVRAYAHEGQAEPPVFRLIGAVLEALERGREPLALVRYFEFWILRLHGLLPDLDLCGTCGAALPATAAAWVVPGHGLGCAACRAAERAGAARLTRADRATLELFVSAAPDTLPRGSAGSPGGALERLLRGALESFAERGFRAYRHLGPGRAPSSGATP